MRVGPARCLVGLKVSPGKEGPTCSLRRVPEPRHELGACRLLVSSCRGCSTRPRGTVMGAAWRSRQGSGARAGTGLSTLTPTPQGTLTVLGGKARCPVWA